MRRAEPSRQPSNPAIYTILGRPSRRGLMHAKANGCSGCHGPMPEGRQGYCKDCRREYSAARRMRERERERDAVCLLCWQRGCGCAVEWIA